MFTFYFIEELYYDANPFYFLATNFAVMLVLGIILNVTGIAGNSTGGILIMAMLFGFAGSLISLFLSKTNGIALCGCRSDY